VAAVANAAVAARPTRMHMAMDRILLMPVSWREVIALYLGAMPDSR
jgi:hypothetical protein